MYIVNMCIYMYIHCK